MIAHTLFSASPFKPKGYNQAVVPAHRMGGLDDWVDFFGDFLGVDDINAGNVNEFLGKIDDLIDALPVGGVKKNFKDQRAECMTKNLFRKYDCLWGLFQDVKRAVRDEDGGAPIDITPPPATSPVSRADEFPWVPVGIAGGITVAALVYLVVRKKA